MKSTRPNRRFLLCTGLKKVAAVFAFLILIFLVNLTKQAEAGTFKTLHAFQGAPDGSTPQYVNLILDSKGNLWGTTSIGGKQNQGTVFKVGKKGTETVFYSFTGSSFGQAPYAGVIEDAKGNFYGTTRTGGIYQLGNVYELDASGNETDLYDFAGNSQGGATGPTLRTPSLKISKAISTAQLKMAGQITLAPCSSWMHKGKRPFCIASPTKKTEDIPSGA
jgi:uncharacterized repeat protein (TIGR03803 family)